MIYTQNVYQYLKFAIHISPKNEATIIGSDTGLSPGKCQAIIQTNAGILLIG